MLKVGDKVKRYIAGAVFMDLTVTSISDYIYCGDYVFSKKNGAEVDEYLGWTEKATGSYIVPHE